MSNKGVNCEFDSEEMYESCDEMEKVIARISVEARIPELGSKELMLAYKKLQLAFEKCDLSRRKAEEKIQDMEIEYIAADAYKKLEEKCKELDDELEAIKEDNSITQIALRDLSLSEINKVEEFLNGMFPNSNEHKLKVFMNTLTTF